MSISDVLQKSLKMQNRELCEIICTIRSAACVHWNFVTFGNTCVLWSDNKLYVLWAGKSKLENHKLVGTCDLELFMIDEHTLIATRRSPMYYYERRYQARGLRIDIEKRNVSEILTRNFDIPSLRAPVRDPNTSLKIHMVRGYAVLFRSVESDVMQMKTSLMKTELPSALINMCLSYLDHNIAVDHVMKDDVPFNVAAARTERKKLAAIDLTKLRQASAKLERDILAKTQALNILIGKRAAIEDEIKSKRQRIE